MLSPRAAKSLREAEYIRNNESSKVLQMGTIFPGECAAKCRHVGQYQSPRWWLSVWHSLVTQASGGWDREMWTPCPHGSPLLKRWNPRLHPDRSPSPPPELCSRWKGVHLCCIFADVDTAPHVLASLPVVFREAALVSRCSVEGLS